MINKSDKREMIKSLLKYNPNKPFDNKKIRQIENELKNKYMKGKGNKDGNNINNNNNNLTQNESQVSLMITNEQKDVTERYESLQRQKSIQQQQFLSPQQSPTQMYLTQTNLQNKNTKSQKAFYEVLQNQYKNYVIGGGSNYNFYAQKKLQMRNQNKYQSSLGHYQSVPQLESINNLKTTIAPTEKAKKFIIDKSSMNKSTQKLGINLPSPLVFKNHIGLTNQSELKRYENVIGKLQQLALRLDLNKNLLSHQRPVLRNFVDLHKIHMPLVSDLDEQLSNEEKIISYVERRRFLDINDQVKQLKSIEDHFEYAVSGQIKDSHQHQNFNNTSRNISMNQTQSMNDISRNLGHSKSKIVYNEGCGIALVNEKLGKFDTSTIQYFETGISLSKVLGYMKIVADIKNYVLLEGNAMKIYKFTEDGEGQGKWVVIQPASANNDEEFVFEDKTLYAISAYQNIQHN